MLVLLPSAARRTHYYTKVLEFSGRLTERQDSLTCRAPQILTSSSVSLLEELLEA